MNYIFYCLKKNISDITLSILLTCIIFNLSIGTPVTAGTLSCSITTAAACSNTIILRMSAASNAHSELPSQSTGAYANNVICCSGVSGLGNSCSGTFATVLKLSAVTNAQVAQNTDSTFTQNTCISVSSGSVSIGYQSSNCTGFDTTLASMSASSNAHIGGTATYTTKICGTGVATALTFTVSNQGFANGSTNITPDTVTMATSTLSITTSNTTGWNVTLSGDNKNTTNQNLQRTADTTVQVTDQTEWVDGVATTTAGNAARISALTNSGNVLAFRVMTASSTNGISFVSNSWWGSADSYSTDSVNTLYAGISSSTVSRRVGNAGTGSLSGSAHLNDVQYYLKTSSTQKTGAYTAGLTYTATANP